MQEILSGPAQALVDSGQGHKVAETGWQRSERQARMAPEFGSRAGSHGSVVVVLPLLEHLQSVRVDPQALLDRVGIPRTALEDPRTRLPKRKFEALWRAASEATADPAIALRVSTSVTAGTLGIVGYLASASESRRNAFELVSGFTALLWEDLECELECNDEVAFVRCRTGSRSRGSRFTTEYAIGLTVAMSRSLGVRRRDPIEARFSYPPPPYAAEYERILVLPVRFDAGEDGVLFPISMMDSPNPTADAALRQLFERYAADQLAGIPAKPRLSQRVRACVRTLLPRGSAAADAVAAQLRMSERTLRRRLRAEGTSYQRVLDDVRIELARLYLTQERPAIADVALLLGFSDQSAFTKAFRRWTGRTPARFVREGERR